MWPTLSAWLKFSTIPIHWPVCLANWAAWACRIFTSWCSFLWFTKAWVVIHQSFCRAVAAAIASHLLVCRSLCSFCLAFVLWLSWAGSGHDRPLPGAAGAGLGLGSLCFLEPFLVMYLFCSVHWNNYSILSNEALPDSRTKHKAN